MSGKNGIGNVDDNGQLLQSKCAEHDLIITNSIFGQRDKFKDTWRQPILRHWHLIRKKDLEDIKITEARKDSEC